MAPRHRNRRSVSKITKIINLCAKGLVTKTRGTIMVRQLMRRAQRADRAAYEERQKAAEAAYEERQKAAEAAYEERQKAAEAALEKRLDQKHEETQKAAEAALEKRWNQKHENLEQALLSIQSRDFMKDTADHYRACYRETQNDEHGKRVMTIMHGARLLIFLGKSKSSQDQKSSSFMKALSGLKRSRKEGNILAHTLTISDAHKALDTWVQRTMLTTSDLIVLQVDRIKELGTGVSPKDMSRMDELESQGQPQAKQVANSFFRLKFSANKIPLLGRPFDELPSGIWSTIRKKCPNLDLKSSDNLASFCQRSWKGLLEKPSQPRHLKQTMTLMNQYRRKDLSRNEQQLPKRNLRQSKATTGISSGALKPSVHNGQPTTRKYHTLHLRNGLATSVTRVVKSCLRL